MLARILPSLQSSQANSKKDITYCLANGKNKEMAILIPLHFDIFKNSTQRKQAPNHYTDDLFYDIAF